jgi:iron complex outermembrane receptor protein
VRAQTASEVPPAGISLPRVIDEPPAEYPADADGRTVAVDLALTLDVDGHVSEAAVLERLPEDASAEFDAAALELAKRLRFAPALRAGQPIGARIHFRVVIAPPKASAASPAADGGGSANRAAAAPVGVHESRSDRAPVAEPSAAPASGANVSDSAAVGESPQPSPPDRTTPGTEPAAPSGTPPDAEPAFGATAHSRTLKPPPARAASDFFQPVGALHDVPHRNASDYLRLAPGMLLTNEGGEGHAERVYLRGFDAREGQDVEFTVDGVPFNEAGNPHGEGYADTHFIVPELIQAVRVLEGPFDPHQGNYAVAGSADYVLGLPQRGSTVTLQAGSFNTQRLLLLWGPQAQRTGTFVGADVSRSDGFGQNRASTLGRAIGQWELDLGNSRTLRLTATSYATRFESAGVVREDDVDAGRIGFYGTYDPEQGGDAQRHSLAIAFSEQHPNWTLKQQAFVVQRDLRLRFDFTGFLEDPPEPYRTGTAQRGDMTDQAYSALTLGARGSLRETHKLFGFEQSLELGYFARHDGADSSQRRLRFGTTVPYRVDFDYTHSISNLALYIDTELRFLRWLALRGGVRGDMFEYDTLDHCALHDTVLNSATPALDQLCYDRDRSGPRDPTTRRSASGLAFEPRATLLVGPFADVTLVASVGSGVRAADPSYLADGDKAPFSSITAGEAGAVWNHVHQRLNFNLRALYYYTRVGRDLIFDQQQGRNTLAPGTTRQGMLAAARVSGSFFDVAASGTYARARFDRTAADPANEYFPADTGNQVPFIPSWVGRLDGALFGALPQLQLGTWPLKLRASSGISYASPRPLLFGEMGQTLFVVDAAVGAAAGPFEIGLSAQNLFDSRYRLAEYNYVSEFRPNPVAPNLLPVRHFSAGPPRTLMLTLTVHLDSPAAGAT